MTQQQIMSLKILSLPSVDLREEIYNAVAKNPALDLYDDSFENGVATAGERSRFSDDIHYGKPGREGELASDNFQSALENNVDSRESLYSHLEFQIEAMNIPDCERNLCLKLIHNLNRDGFHILAPVSLIDRNDPLQTEELLERCIERVQRLDPIGTCCRNIEESLFVQAKLASNPSPLALFILDGHFDFLNPPQVPKILKKIKSFLDEQKKMAFASNKNDPIKVSENEVEEALNFIKTLDPKPTRNFGTEQAFFVRPDVYVERIPAEENDSEKLDSFRITLARENIPKLRISDEFKSFTTGSHSAHSAHSFGKNKAEESERIKSEKKYVQDSVQKARVFIESLEYRENSILKAAEEIVRSQRLFFEKGSRYLLPLRQKDVAERIGVHEATVSRMANGKYLSCEWGVFEFGYFFTNSVSASESLPSTTAGSASAVKSGNSGKNSDDFVPSSKEGVKAEIAQLLEEHKSDKKALSDQKIADLLSERGIKIARRTVAKYRNELNINSSYVR